METLFSVKELFNKVLNCKNLDSRPVKTYVNNSSRTNYIFNSQISNLEKSDFIFKIEHGLFPFTDLKRLSLSSFP